MQSDVPEPGMLKSYKKVSRWYPSMEPSADATPAEQPGDDSAFEEEDGPARFPHYIRDEEPELEIPPVPDSVLRRSHYNGAWSDWMRDGETGSYSPQSSERDSTVVEFPWGSGQSGDEPGDDAPRAKAASTSRSTATAAPDRASELLDAIADEAAPGREVFARRRLFALAFLVVAVLLLAIAGGFALYVLNSHGGSAQSLGTPAAHTHSGPVPAVAAYNEMTAIAIIGDHGPTAGIPAG